MGSGIYFILNLSGNKLTLDVIDLAQVMEEVLDVSAQWYHLGLQLKVRTGTLDRIRVQFSDPEGQLLEMLKTWLTTSENTHWKTLIDALRSRAVGASQLADVLEKKYFVVEPTEVDIGTFASDSWCVTPHFYLSSFPNLLKIGPPSKVSPLPFFNKVVAKCDLVSLPIYPIVHVVMLTKEALYCYFLSDAYLERLRYTVQEE